MRLSRSFTLKLIRSLSACLAVLAAWVFLDRVVLTLSAEHWPLERRLSVRQTPRLADGPWVIDYDLETPRAARDGAEETPENLPISQLLPAAP